MSWASYCNEPRFEGRLSKRLPCSDISVAYDKLQMLSLVQVWCCQGKAAPEGLGSTEIPRSEHLVMKTADWHRHGWISHPGRYLPCNTTAPDDPQGLSAPPTASGNCFNRLPDTLSVFPSTRGIVSYCRNSSLLCP